MPLYSPSASISASPVTIKSALPATAHSSIRFIYQYFKLAPGFDYRGDLGQQYRGSGELFAIAAELARQHPQQFIDNGFGNDKPIIPVYDAVQRLFGTAARKHKRRDIDISVENDFHEFR